MNKTMKIILGTLIIGLVSFNLITISLLNKMSAKLEEFNSMNQRIQVISSTIAAMNNNALNNLKQSKEEQQDYMMTPSELAEYLKVDVTHVYSTIIDNPKSKFPRIVLDLDIRFSKNAIDEYMLKGNIN
jgi:plasmid maintenance system killer protein